MCLLILKSSMSFISALPYILWNKRLCLLLNNFQVSAEQMNIRWGGEVRGIVIVSGIFHCMAANGNSQKLGSYNK